MSDCREENLEKAEAVEKKLGGNGEIYRKGERGEKRNCIEIKGRSRMIGREMYRYPKTGLASENYSSR